MAEILMLYEWNIDEKKATFCTTPSPDWFKPKQNNTFATLGLFYLHSLILGEVRGTNSQKICSYLENITISQLEWNFAFYLKTDLV